MNDSIQALIDQVVAFRDARDWKQFHNPKDLAISISLEAAELLEVFQWTGSDPEVNSDKKKAKVKEELADVLMYCLLMADNLDLDISQIVLDKIKVNEQKYPVEISRGKADKYTAYISRKEG